MSPKKTLFFPLFVLFFILSCSNEKIKTNAQNRFVITSPEIAEIIAAIDGTENIVGITTDCDYPPELQKKNKVGTFGKVDLEKVIKLNPTMVFTSGLEQDYLTSELQKLKIPVMKIYPQSVAGLITAIRDIGRTVGKTIKANALADSLEERINDFILQNVSVIRPKVYVEIYGNPIMSVSSDSFVGEIIELAGGENIFSELPRNYSRIKPEKVIEKNPDIIILTYPGITARQIKERKGWANINACKNNKIFTTNDINPDLILRASPRIIDGINQLKKIIIGNSDAE
ncbi:MAG: hypothetical protein B6D62_00820 [Candidatus Cloacimonas sp. 4484_275]|nr:MAG: hypothetical protein B6D62_00820 [Candidatus Cloacimonas sp. 4484_275]RLC51030.1 MAG: cobalamin-binding protein [Candidatus Cloacimonadota bacterium]